MSPYSPYHLIRAKAKVNNTLNHSYGATYIRRTGIPLTGVSKTPTDQAVHPNQNGHQHKSGVTTTNGMVIRPMHVERERANLLRPPRQRKGTKAPKAKLRALTVSGKAATSLQITTRLLQYYRQSNHHTCNGGTQTKKSALSA